MMLTKQIYDKPEIKEILLTSIDGVADGTPGMNNSRMADDDDDKVKGEVVWAEEEPFQPLETNLWLEEW